MVPPSQRLPRHLHVAILNLYQTLGAGYLPTDQILIVRLLLGSYVRRRCPPPTLFCNSVVASSSWPFYLSAHYCHLYGFSVFQQAAGIFLSIPQARAS